MRTKFYLTALCLPLAFAACTSEDLMPEGVQMPQRQQIDVTLTAEKPVIGADSRLGIDEENNFLWEKDVDMIGAALTDGATLNTPANEILVNYPFTADNSAKASTFSGKSSVTEGTYFFYYGYQDVLNRGKLNLNVPAQTYDVDAEKSAKEQAVSYMKMISPLVKLSGVTYEDAQSYNIPLEFVNLYTLVRVQISSENIPDGMTPKVTKVSLNEGGGTGFIKEATADIATNIAVAGVSGYDANGEWEASLYATNLATLATKVYNGGIYDVTGTVVRGAAAVTVDGDLPLSETAATDVYLLVPKGGYTSLELVVETSEGVYTRDITSATAIEFNDNIRALAAELNFAQDGSGNVVLPASFDINSTEEWNNAVQFMTDHSVGYLNKTVSFNLMKSIEIANMPIFNLAINGAAYNHVNLATGVASNGNPTLTLSSNYTISDENVGQFTIQNVKLGVAAGATLTVKNANVAFDEIVNQGILNINTDAIVSTPIVNLATANINGGSTVSNLQNGRAAVPASGVTKIEGTLNVATGKTATVTALTSQAGTISVPSTSKLTVAGGSNAALISVNGELDGTFNNSGTVDNYGKLSAAVTNTGGTVKVEKGSVSDNAQTVDGGTVVIVDVTDFSALQISLDKTSSHYVFANATVTTVVTNGAEYANADACSEINDITLATGTWNLMGSVASPSTANKNIEVPTYATSLTLDAATLNLGVALGKNINVTGASAFTASAAVAVTGNLTVNAGATMSVGANVTMNAAATTNAQTATINGALTVNPGAAMYFDTANVGAAGNLTVMGESAVAAAIFGVQTTFGNAGLVESKAATKVGGGNAGQVSLPTNTGTGTFKGNATTIAFN